MRLIAFDIETWGLEEGYTLQPWRVKEKASGILSIAFSDGVTQTVSSFKPSKQEITKLLARYSKDDCLLCGWNLKFDLAFLIASGFNAKLCKFKFLDGMLLAKRLSPDLIRYGLKATLAHFADKVESRYDYSSDIEFKIGNPKKVYSDEEQAAMLHYNSLDALYTHRLIAYLRTQDTYKTMPQAIRESTIAYLFADSWQRGITIDKNYLEKYALDINTKCDKLELICEKVGLSKIIISSPQKLQSYLIDKGVRLTLRTASGNYSVDSKTLKKLYHESSNGIKQIVRLIIKYKELLTEKTKFVNAALECTQTSELIHPDPILSSTYTGRLTYSVYQKVKKVTILKNGNERISNKQLKIGIPIHQIKKKGNLRTIFSTPADHSLVELDFCAQEMRLIACVANEPTMISLFNENKDMHAYTAARIMSISYDEFLALKETDNAKYSEMRFIGKNTNLSLQYRMGAKSLYRQWHDNFGLIKTTEHDAYTAREAYLSAYSGIQKYWNQNIAVAKSQLYVENMARRRYPLREWDPMSEYSSSQTAINYPIQSTGAEQKILALYCLKDTMRKNQIKFAWDLHDGLYFYVPKSLNQLASIQEMVDILNNLPYTKAWGWHPQVAFPVEAKIGENWGNLKLIGDA